MCRLLVFDVNATITNHELYGQWRAWRQYSGYADRFGQSLIGFMRTFLSHDLCEVHHVHVLQRGSRKARTQTIVGVKIADDDLDEDGPA